MQTGEDKTVFMLPFFHCKICVDKMSGGPHVDVMKFYFGTNVTLWADMDRYGLVFRLGQNVADRYVTVWDKIDALLLYVRKKSHNKLGHKIL
jgi:hypothetical protein